MSMWFYVAEILKNTLNHSSFDAFLNPCVFFAYPYRYLCTLRGARQLKKVGGREREREEGGVERKLKREKEAEPDSAREYDTSLEVYLRLVPAV